MMDRKEHRLWGETGEKIPSGSTGTLDERVADLGGVLEPVFKAGQEQAGRRRGLFTRGDPSVSGVLGADCQVVGTSAIRPEHPALVSATFQRVPHRSAAVQSWLTVVAQRSFD